MQAPSTGLEDGLQDGGLVTHPLVWELGVEPSSQANPTRVSHWVAMWLHAGFAKIVWKPCVEWIGGRYAPGGVWCGTARTLTRQYWLLWECIGRRSH